MAALMDRSSLDRAIVRAAIDLEEKGYAVIPNVVSAYDCDATVNSIWTWLERLNPWLDRHDPETWKTKGNEVNWPNSIHGIIQHFEVAHQDFVWKIRKHPRVRRAFECLWGENELLSSFDGICVMKAAPVRKGKQWLHTDQSGRKIGMQCIQGLINLEAVGPGNATLCVLSGSHKLHAAAMASHQGPTDWHKYTEADMHFFRNCPEVRVQGGKGSMFLWDSRVAHSNVNATIPHQPRYVIYTCYQPRKLATAKDLAKKVKAFEEYRVTTHWPAQNVSLFPKKPRDYGVHFIHGNLTALRTRDRVQDHTLLQLAGVERLPTRQHQSCTGLLFQQPSDLQTLLGKRRFEALIAFDDGE